MKSNRSFSPKTAFIQAIAIGVSLYTLTSCATVFGGQRTVYQVTKPRPGEPQRQVRVGAMVADILLFWPSTVVDFATGAIYKPAPAKNYPRPATIR